MEPRKKKFAQAFVYNVVEMYSIPVVDVVGWTITLDDAIILRIGRPVKHV